jgi:hypothetical protein
LLDNVKAHAADSPHKYVQISAETIGSTHDCHNHDSTQSIAAVQNAGSLNRSHFGFISQYDCSGQD